MTSYDLYHSKPGHTSDLAIFETPRVNSAVEQIEIVRYKPVSALTEKPSVVDFQIANISPKYLDLSRSRLTVECKVVNGDNSAIVQDSMTEGVMSIPRESRVGLTNYTLHSMWSNVELSLQNQVISPHVVNNYQYKAIIDALCRNTLSPGEMAAAMFYRDDSEFMDDLNTGVSAGNPAQAKRRLMIQDSRRFIMSGVINHDICHQGRLILNNLPLTLRLYPAKDEFVLVSSIDPEVSPPAATFKLLITDVSFDVCYVKPSASVLLSQDRVLRDDRKARYPYMRSVVKTVHVPKGSQTFAVDDIYSSYLPADFYAVFVDSEAYVGKYNKYGYMFSHANVSRIGLYIDGQSKPQKPYETSFEDDKWNKSTYMDAYMGLLGSNPEKCSISYQEFGEYYTIFRFELDKYTDGVFPRPKRGHARLEVSFSKATDKNYTLVLYGLFSSLMEVDVSRNLYLTD